MPIGVEASPNFGVANRESISPHHLAHQTFADTDALDQAIHQAVDALNTERMVLPLARPRISA